MPISAVADDLSGAAEVAAVLCGLSNAPVAGPTAARFGWARVRLVGANPSNIRPAEPAEGGRRILERLTGPQPAGEFTARVFDSDNRRKKPEEAGRRMKTLLNQLPVTEPLFLKFDSLLRGNVGAELVSALAHAPVVFAPSVPANGRTVRGGILQVNDTPLHKTNLWDNEPGPPAVDIAGQLSPAPTRHVDLETVRTDGLVDALTAAARAEQIAVCDADTDADLDAIAAAVVRLGYIAAGAAGLAEAFATVWASTRASAGGSRSIADTTGYRQADFDELDDAGTLLILGTANSAQRQQLDTLAATGVPIHRVHPDALPDFDPGPAAIAAIAVDAAIDPASAPAILKALTDMALRCHRGRHLVLSGGETARAVLGALGIMELFPLAQAHPGAIVSVTETGRLVATRPGSYGSADSLVSILATMQSIKETT